MTEPFMQTKHASLTTVKRCARRILQLSDQFRLIEIIMACYLITELAKKTLYLTVPPKTEARIQGILDGLGKENDTE